MPGFQDLLHRRITIKTSRQRRLVLSLSLIIGILSGLAAVLLKNTVHYATEFIMHGFDFAEGNYLYLILPLIGIGLTVLFSLYIVKDNISHGVARILYAISRRNGKIDAHNMYSSMIGSTFTIGFGGSMGLEAPIVLTGSALGSYLGRRFHLDHKTINILIGAGATGALAGIFKAPIAAVVFSLEVLMLDLTMITLIPLLISSATAATIAFFFMGPRVMFSFELIDPFYLKHLPWYILLGVFTGLISLYFTRATLSIESGMGKLKHRWQKWLIGAIPLGIMIYVFPALYGEGYQFMYDLVDQKVTGLVNETLFNGFDSIWYLILFLGLIMVFKVVAMALTGGSGGVGGIFAPSLFVGSIGGVFFSKLINQLWPFADVPEKNMALVGMAGVMAGVMQAPLTGVFLIAESTGGYELFTPLIFTAVISYLTVMLFEQHGIYTKRLAERGELMTHDKDRNVLQMMKVDRLIETNFRKVDLSATMREFTKEVAKSQRNVFPVVDKDNNFYGVIFINDIRNIIFNTELWDATMVRDLMFMPDT
ncbi:MAG TPA: chloride channel protein, partial [Bacteroidetes bacterium]|nr:chloride channel protein [Bacteroidota bacterium]